MSSMKITIRRRGINEVYKYKWRVTEPNSRGIGDTIIDEGYSHFIWSGKMHARSAIKKIKRDRDKGIQRGEVVHEEWV